MKSSAKHKKLVFNYEVYPKGGVAETMMHQNMSSHYRRVYNAKPRVDTGPPFSHKAKLNYPPKPFCWNKNPTGPLTSKQRLPLAASSTIHRKKGCSVSSVTEVPSFRAHTQNSSTESKLRSMRVYHPPRKRMIVKSLLSSSIQQISRVPEVPVPEILWTHSENIKSAPCDGSGSDSAYTEEGEGGWSFGESRGPTPESDTPRAISTENLMYVKFVRGITEDVLENGVYTNKALKEIFQKHIDSHKQFLNLRRMHEEVRKLQAELGILDQSNQELHRREFNHFFDISTIDENAKTSIEEDQELLDALCQLNISPLLKADIANSLGLNSAIPLSRNGSSSRSKNIHSFNTLKSTQGIVKQATFSSPLEDIFDANQQIVKKIGNNPKLPQSDDDSYEILSECSESRPITPLGLVW